MWIDTKTTGRKIRLEVIGIGICSYRNWKILSLAEVGIFRKYTHGKTIRFVKIFIYKIKSSKYNNYP